MYSIYASEGAQQKQESGSEDEASIQMYGHTNRC